MHVLAVLSLFRDILELLGLRKSSCRVPPSMAVASATTMSAKHAQ